MCMCMCMLCMCMCMWGLVSISDHDALRLCRCPWFQRALGRALDGAHLRTHHGRGRGRSAPRLPFRPDEPGAAALTPLGPAAGCRGDGSHGSRRLRVARPGRRRHVLPATASLRVRELLPSHPNHSSSRSRTPLLSTVAATAQDALEPHIDAATMKFHHDFHHQAYINNLNKASPPRP